MDNQQMQEIRKSFKELEEVLSSAKTVGGLFKDNPRFNNAFSAARQNLGALEKEWILEEPGTFNSRDAVVSVIETLEVLRSYVEQGLVPQTDKSLQDRLREAKYLLNDVNSHIEPKQ